MNGPKPPIRPQSSSAERLPPASAIETLIPTGQRPSSSRGDSRTTRAPSSSSRHFQPSSATVSRTISRACSGGAASSRSWWRSDIGEDSSSPAPPAIVTVLGTRRVPDSEQRAQPGDGVRAQPAEAAEPAVGRLGTPASATPIRSRSRSAAFRRRPGSPSAARRSQSRAGLAEDQRADREQQRRDQDQVDRPGLAAGRGRRTGSGCCSRPASCRPPPPSRSARRRARCRCSAGSAAASCRRRRRAAPILDAPSGAPRRRPRRRGSGVETAEPLRRCLRRRRLRARRRRPSATACVDRRRRDGRGCAAGRRSATGAAATAAAGALIGADCCCAAASLRRSACALPAVWSPAVGRSRRRSSRPDAGAGCRRHLPPPTADCRRRTTLRSRSNGVDFGRFDRSCRRFRRLMERRTGGVVTGGVVTGVSGSRRAFPVRSAFRPTGGGSSRRRRRFFAGFVGGDRALLRPDRQRPGQRRAARQR